MSMQGAVDSGTSGVSCSTHEYSCPLPSFLKEVAAETGKDGESEVFKHACRTVPRLCDMYGSHLSHRHDLRSVKDAGEKICRGRCAHIIHGGSTSR